MWGKRSVVVAVLLIAAVAAFGGGGKESTGAPVKEDLSTVPTYTERDIARAVGLQSTGQVLKQAPDGLLAVLDHGEQSAQIVFVDREGNRKRTMPITGFTGGVSRFALGSDGAVCVLLTEYAMGKDGKTPEGVSHVVRIYGPGGSPRSDWDLGSTPYSPEAPYTVSDMAVDSRGVVYLATSTGLETAKGPGPTAKTRPGPSFSAVVLEAAGKLIVGGYDRSGGSGAFIAKIEPASGKELWKVSGGYPQAIAYRLSDGGIYVYDGKRVLKLDADGGLLGVAFEARDHSLPEYQSYGPCMAVDDGGSLCFLAAKYDRTEPGSRPEPHFLVYERSTEAANATAPALTISHAIYSQREIDIAIRLYQKAHPGATVEVKRTIERADMQGGTDYRVPLVTEIMAGKGADLINCWLMPYESLARKGALADLDKLMAGDASFRSEEYFSSVFDAFRVNGVLYALPTGYSVDLMMASTGALEDAGVHIDDMRWSWEDFVALAEKVKKDTNGDGTPDQYALYKMTGYQFFAQFLIRDRIGDFVDREKKTARFDSGEFADLLELAKRTEDRGLFSPDTDLAGWTEACARGTGVFYATSMNNHLILSTFKEAFPRGMTPLRRPDAARRGTALSIVFPYAANARSPRLQAAWDFLKTMVSYDMQVDSNLIYLRVNRKACAAEIARWQEQAKKGQVTSNIGSRMVHPGAPTDADVAFGDALIAEVRRSGDTDTELTGIVGKEARRYFSGEIGADEAARAVQGKVAIYLSE